MLIIITLSILFGLLIGLLALKFDKTSVAILKKKNIKTNKYIVVLIIMILLIAGVVLIKYIANNS